MSAGCRIKHWCNITGLKVRAATEKIFYDRNDNFYDKLKNVLYQFSKYYMKILLGNFNAKVGREDIFKRTVWNKSLHEVCNVIGVGVVNLATSKNLIVMNSMFPHRSIHKLLMESHIIRLTTF